MLLFSTIIARQCGNHPDVIDKRIQVTEFFYPGIADARYLDISEEVCVLVSDIVQAHTDSHD